MTTLLLMGASTTLVGCLPTHDQAGAAAPALLAALRICMGLSLGAEYTTAVVYAHEAARYRKGKAAGSAAVAAACALGSLGGLVVVMIVQAAAGAERMAAWGWRVPFLAALPIVAVALFLRLRMRESDVFVAAREARLLLQEGRGGAGGELSPAAGGVKAGTPKGADGGGPAAAGGAGPARKARRGAGPRCGPLAGAPLAQLLRRRWLAWCMDVAFVTWLASLLYVVYAWLPAALRSTGVMTPMLSYGMVMVSLAAEFGCILLGGWVAPRTRALALAAAGAPLASALCVGGAAAAGARSAGGAWAVQNAALGAGGLLLGVHAAAFVYIYPPEMRSTGGRARARSAVGLCSGAGGAAGAGAVAALPHAGARGGAHGGPCDRHCRRRPFAPLLCPPPLPLPLPPGFSLAYNTGCALGGASPAVVTALQMAAPHARLAGLIPGLWLLILSAPAAAAALALLALAPQADTCGRGEEEAGGGAPRGAAAAGAAALV